MDAVAGHVLGVMLGLRGQFGQLAGIQVATAQWMQMHHTNGQRQQGKLLTQALAIQGDKTAGLQMLTAVETPALGLEIIHQLVEPLTPILGAEHQQKVIATNMPDKVAAGVHSVVEALCQAQQHFIATPIAVDIVEWDRFVKVN